MDIRVIFPAEGEMSGGGPIRARIVKDGSHTEHRLGIIEVTLLPGPAQPAATYPPGARRNLHRYNDA